MNHMRLPTALVVLLASVACDRERPAPPLQRLVDLYKPEMVEGRAAPAPPAPRTEWRFDKPAQGFDGLTGIAGLAVKDGRLSGRTTATPAVLHVERTQGLADKDLVHEIQVRLRVSAGHNLSVTFSRGEKVDLPRVLDQLRNFPTEFHTPLVPGPEFHTYTLKSQQAAASDGLRQVFVVPSDVAGASFEIESVRVVFRREHLAEVASGLGWQGLSEVYHETLVSRSPETLRVPVRLSERSRLELALGTIEDDPVTFRISARTRGSSRETLLFQKTLTRPHRWEDVTLDLSRVASRNVSLGLSLVSEKPGAIGFWGSPSLRSGVAPERPRQNVILIWADTLRRDHIGAYGYARPTTPHLDRMAEEGALFRDCIGQASWTKVATPSLLTSLYPTTHTVKDFIDRVPSSATTLAEVYRAAGYETLSFSSILFTGRFSNMHQGFETVHESGSLPDHESSKTAREYVDRLLPWLGAHRDAPFFVFLHVADPHDPYRPKAPYDTLYTDAASVEEHARQDKELLKVIADPLLRNMGSPMATREELAKAKLDAQKYLDVDRAFYDGSIRGMDAEIGRLLEGLKSIGLAGRTLVAFTTDHGEEFLEHGRMFHGQTVYGEMNNMSLILWEPGVIAKGLRLEPTVETIDVMPTLLELSGLDVPREAQGQSLASLVRAAGGAGAGSARADSGFRERPAISEKALTDDNDSPPPHDTESTAIIDAGFKLIHHTHRAPGAPEFELFDHRADPLDQSDVAAQHPEVVAKLAKALAAWHAGALAARLKPEAAQQMSGEDLERLRALGYVQ